MRRFFTIAAALAVASVVGAPGALPGGGPVTKQNGKSPASTSFTSICSIDGFLNYGSCGGDATKYTDIRGRIDAVQAKPGRWNLNLTFSNLQPGVLYRLWGNRSGITPVPGNVAGFFAIATATAGLDGKASFSHQTTDPVDLGFDLNMLPDPAAPWEITVVTSWWSQQTLQRLDAIGNLYVPGA
jgi:hypothetical protein